MSQTINRVVSIIIAVNTKTQNFPQTDNRFATGRSRPSRNKNVTLRGVRSPVNENRSRTKERKRSIKRRTYRSAGNGNRKKKIGEEGARTLKLRWGWKCSLIDPSAVICRRLSPSGKGTSVYVFLSLLFFFWVLPSPRFMVLLFESLYSRFIVFQSWSISLGLYASAANGWEPGSACSVVSKPTGDLCFARLYNVYEGFCFFRRLGWKK